MKAQTNLTFNYVLVAVLVGIIILVGAYGVQRITGEGDESALHFVVTELQNAVTSHSTRYNSVTEYEIKVPFNLAHEMCFADSLSEGSYSEELKGKVTSLASSESRYALIANAINDDSKQNVFFFYEGKMTQAFYIEKLDVVDDIFCIENKGRPTVRMRGTGRLTELSEV